MSPSRSVQLAICLAAVCVLSAKGNTLREYGTNGEHSQLLSLYVESPFGASIRAKSGTCRQAAVDTNAFPPEDLEIKPGMRYLIELEVATGFTCNIVWELTSESGAVDVTQQLAVSEATLTSGTTFTNLCDNGVCCGKDWRSTGIHTCPSASCTEYSIVKGRQADSFHELCGSDASPPIVLVGSYDTLCILPDHAVANIAALGAEPKSEDDEILRFSSTSFIDKVMDDLNIKYNWKNRNENDYKAFHRKLEDELAESDAETRSAESEKKKRLAVLALADEKSKEIAVPDPEWYNHIPQKVTDMGENSVTNNFFATLCSNEVNTQSGANLYPDMYPKNAFINMGWDGDYRQVYFQTEIFAGRAKLRLKHVEKAPGAKTLTWRNSKIFNTKEATNDKREFDIQIDGYFKVDGVNIMDPVYGMGLRGWGYKNEDVDIPYAAKYVDKCLHNIVDTHSGDVYVSGSNFPCSLKAIYDTGVDIDEAEALEPGLAMRKLYGMPYTEKLVDDGMPDALGQNRCPLKDGYSCEQLHDPLPGSIGAGLKESEKEKKNGACANYNWGPRHAYFKSFYDKTKPPLTFAKNRIYAFNTWADHRLRLDAFEYSVAFTTTRFHDILEKNNIDNPSANLRPYRLEGSLDGDPSKTLFCIAIYNMKPNP